LIKERLSKKLKKIQGNFKDLNEKLETYEKILVDKGLLCSENETTQNNDENETVGKEESTEYDETSYSKEDMKYNTSLDRKKNKT